MNFGTLEEKIWVELGLHDTAQRLNWRRQSIRDAINLCLDEVASTQSPGFWTLTRETTIAIVAGTSVYNIDDWCVKPLALWTQDAAGHEVMFRAPRVADRIGLRNPNAVSTQYGPWELTWKQQTTDSSKSGTGASVSEGNTSVTGLSGMASTDIGRMIRFNGEDEDYKISGVGGATVCTLDRAVKGRLTGLSTTGTGSGYSSAAWQVGPPGRQRLSVLPIPTYTQTLYIRYIARPRRLVNTTDVPELPDEFHDLLWKGALRVVAGLFQRSQDAYQMYAAEYSTALERLRQWDSDTFPTHDTPKVFTGLDHYPEGMPVDVHRRGEW